MSVPLRVLHLEDNPSDAELIASLLTEAGIVCETKVVDTREAFVAALENETFRLILSDFSLPSFDGMSALTMASEKQHDVPFIFVSGTVGEEQAIEMMRHGATDYVLKLRLSRLVPVIRRALHEVEERKERERAEQTLLRLKKAIDTSGEAIFLTDREGVFTFVNPGFTHTYGYAAAEVVGKVTPRILKGGLVAASVYEMFWKTLASGQEVRGEHINRRKDGTPVDIEGSANAILDEEKNIIGFLGIQRDITERRRAEEALKQSEERYHDLYDNAPTMLASVDHVSGKVIESNNTFLKRTGFERSEVIGSHIFERYHPDCIEKAKAAFDKLTEYGEVKNAELELLTVLGGKIPVLLNVSSVRDEAGMILHSRWVWQDITELRRAEEKIRQSEERYRAVADSAVDSIITVDEAGIIIGWNQGATRTFGYNEKEILGHTMDMLMPESHRDGHNNGFNRLQEGGEPRVIGKTVELEGKRKDGSVFPLELSLAEWETIEGRFFSGIIRDITERKRAEDALKNSEEQYRQFFEDDLTGDYLCTPEGKILSCNPAFAHIFGFTSPEEVLKTNQGVFRFDPVKRDRFLNLLREKRKLEYFEMEYLRRDGARVYTVENAIGVFDPQGNLVQIRGYLFDDTKRKSLEQQLIQAQKLESIGILAGGIAHDFNNILGIILAYATLLQRGTTKQEFLTSSLDIIVNTVQRGAALVRHILTFARKTDVTLTPVNVNESVKELRKMLHETLPKTIEFNVILEESIPLVTIDSGQLDQALLNLCVNARDAILDVKGKRSSEAAITIKTSTISGDTLREKYREASAEQYVSVSVSDTGAGMDDATKQRIFEPFFTTKEIGKGTGLGLSVVYGVIQSANGFVDVQSVLGQGSTFRVYLPVPKEMAVSSKKAKNHWVDVPGGSETLLLVEDEEALLAMLQMTLQDKGYKVITAIDGREALERFKQNWGQIDFVLTDFGLPKMSGEQVLRELKKLKPDIKVVIASGYIDPNQKSEILKAGAKDIIAKPYHQDEVLKKIRAILDAD